MTRTFKNIRIRNESRSNSSGYSFSSLLCLFICTFFTIYLTVFCIFVKNNTNQHIKKESDTISTSYTNNIIQNITTTKILKHPVETITSNVPDDTVTAIVQCSTTAGNITIDVRGKWAPFGSSQFLKLVEMHFFEHMPFFRVCPRYITQFGARHKKYVLPSDIVNIMDDPSLVGIRDIDFGYMFFAGNGVNSRHSQMVISLCNKPGCIVSGLGKAPWEVPFATIRKEGFEALRTIARSGYPYPKLEMSGQHPNAGGPNQLRIESDEDYLKNEYPNMEYWNRCHVEEKDIAMSRPLELDHKEPVEENPMKQSVSTSLKKDNENKVLVKFSIVNLDISTEETKTETGDIVIEVNPQWAPIGAQRFLELVKSGYYNNVRFFRVIKKFMAQFGISGDPEITSLWKSKAIPDDPVTMSNVRGTLSFATSGKNTRTAQVFINFADNSFLDKQGFSPFAQVISGMDVVDRIYSGYGEGGNGDGKDNRGPSQGLINRNGNKYLESVFPKLSYINSSQIIS